MSPLMVGLLAVAVVAFLAACVVAYRQSAAVRAQADHAAHVLAAYAGEQIAAAHLTDPAVIAAAAAHAWAYLPPAVRARVSAATFAAAVAEAVRLWQVPTPSQD